MGLYIYDFYKFDSIISQLFSNVLEIPANRASETLRNLETVSPENLGLENASRRWCRGGGWSKAKRPLSLPLTLKLLCCFRRSSAQSSCPPPHPNLIRTFIFMTRFVFNLTLAVSPPYLSSLELFLPFSLQNEIAVLSLLLHLMALARS